MIDKPVLGKYLYSYYNSILFEYLISVVSYNVPMYLPRVVGMFNSSVFTINDRTAFKVNVL